MKTQELMPTNLNWHTYGDTLIELEDETFLELKIIDYIILAMVYHMTNRGHGYTRGQAGLSEDLGVSLKSVQRSIKKLIEADVMEKNSNGYYTDEDNNVRKGAGGNPLRKPDTLKTTWRVHSLKAERLKEQRSAWIEKGNGDLDKLLPF